MLRPTSFYARQLQPTLPEQTFRPAHSRLWWLLVHLCIIALGIVSLAARWVPWLAAGGVSLLIGASFAGLTFLAHETLHGAVVRGRRMRRLVGTIGFLPFLISPRLWIAWHNRVHHANTNHAGVDPDAYPTLEEYQKHRLLRIVTDHLGPGGRRPNGVLSLLIGFSIQSGHMLLGAKAYGLLSARQRRIAVTETGLAAVAWLSLGVFTGWSTFLFGYALPLLVANATVMAFILTNHSLSPLSDVNDPLFNSLSVRVPRWAEWWTMRFGFHVEHHLFPWMSSRHAPLVRSLILERWPERYQSMPIGRALLALHRTGRVYKDATTLTDRLGGEESCTLLPRDWDAKGRTPLAPRRMPTSLEPLRTPALQEPSI